MKSVPSLVVFGRRRTHAVQVIPIWGPAAQTSRVRGYGRGLWLYLGVMAGVALVGEGRGDPFRVLQRDADAHAQRALGINDIDAVGLGCSDGHLVHVVLITGSVTVEVHRTVSGAGFEGWGVAGGAAWAPAARPWL